MENTLPDIPIEGTEITQDISSPEPSNNATIPWMIVCLLLGIIFAGGFATYYLYKQSQNESSLATKPVQENTSQQTKLMASVTYLTGTAYQLENDRKVEILEGDILEESAIIITEDDSRLVLQLDDGSIISLDSNTKISLSNLNPSQIEIREDSGVMFSRVNKDESHKYLVRAGNYTIESLGTSFSVENKEKVNVKVFESSVNIIKPFKEVKKVEEDKEWTEGEEEPKDIVTEEIEKDEFLAWNIEKRVEEKKITQEPKKEEPKKEVVKEKPNVSSEIKLYGEKKEDGIYVSWTVSGITASKGFKIVKSQDSNPTFPEDGYIYVQDSSVRNYKLTLKDGKTWHIRVCKYNGDGSCSDYSNEVVVTAPDIEKGEKSNDGDVDSITLKVIKKSDTSVKLTWSVDGKSDKGYKVLWGRDSKPTYPLGDGDSYHYYSNSDAREDTIKDLKDGKKYYFRVCEYLGGKCGTYSNQVSIEM